MVESESCILYIFHVKFLVAHLGKCLAFFRAHKRMSESGVNVDPIFLAETLRRGFVGWLHTCDTTEPTLGVAVKNPYRTIARVPNPFSQLEAAIKRNQAELNIVEMNLSTVCGRLFQSVYNGGNGILRDSAACILLVPLTVPVQSPTFSGGTVVCAISGYVCKTPLYNILQQDIMRRIQSVVRSTAEYNLAAFQTKTVQRYYITHPGILKPNQPTAIETLCRLFPRAAAPILSALRAAAVYHKTYADSGSQFKDPAALSASREVLETAILSILDTESGQ